MKVTEEDLMTVGELRALLEDVSDDTRIYFGCYGLQFYRFKQRGEKLIQLEFNQTVYDHEDGRVAITN